eukprot:scaffold626_cov409-Prasinococcus_capsulatus_cf.AAC.27
MAPNKVIETLARGSVEYHCCSSFRELSSNKGMHWSCSCPALALRHLCYVTGPHAMGTMLLPQINVELPSQLVQF